jgi:hypothetical protein
LLTLLSTPKRFDGHFGVIQTNAITSWAHLDPRPEIILFGTDEGTAELCEELGLRHVPDVATNEKGTPLLSDMFRQGQALARNPVVCWSNADVIYTDRLVQAAQVVADHPKPALLVGQRNDIDLDVLVDFDQPGWQDRLVTQARAEDERKSVVWIDYFMFRPGLFADLPDFAIGRPGYDNWLLWRARTDGADLIDATEHVWAIHQRHDYSHAGGKAKVWQGDEAARNDAMIGDWRRKYSIGYANLRLDEAGELHPARGWKYASARPRSAASELLKFTRPIRQRLQGERQTWHRTSAS